MSALKIFLSATSKSMPLLMVASFVLSNNSLSQSLEFIEAPSLSYMCTGDLMLATLALYTVSLMFFFFFGDFLGLYGVFVGLCLVSSVFWVSLLSSFNFFFLEDGEALMTIGSMASLAPALEVAMDLSLDLVSFSFLLLTITMAVFVNFFAFSYFSYEPNVESLLLLLNAFVLSMGLLVMAGNLVILFLGWEMMGLTSFLLMNFWQTSVGTLKASFKAYSFNKFSDSSLLLGLAYFYLLFGDLGLSAGQLSILPATSLLDSSLLLVSPMDLASFFFMSAAFVKSAQLGFHVWLPDSMEAPVPASALMHSATLVSAGVFLLVSLQSLTEVSGYAATVMPLVGSVTAFVGGFSALFQTDLKSMLAYSTMSHCGFLFVLLSLGTLEHTMFYLYVHGFFKASSFLCVGSILSFTHGYQDLSSMGGFWKYLPAEFYFLLFCLSCLAGMPMFFGYSVKHLVLSVGSGSLYTLLVCSFSLLGAFAGLFYSHKMLFFVFFDSKKASKSSYLGSSAEGMKSAYYSNTTLASNFSMACLAIMAYAISYQAASSLVLDPSLSASSGASLMGVELAPLASSVDSGLSFNFKLLNSVVCVLFLFINFFSWSSSVVLSYAPLCTIALVIMLA